MEFGASPHRAGLSGHGPQNVDRSIAPSLRSSQIVYFAGGLAAALVAGLVFHWSPLAGLAAYGCVFAGICKFHQQERTRGGGR